jgi:hypothetical protein
MIKLLLLLLLCFLSVGCKNNSNLIDVKIISIYKNNGSFSDSYSHMILERVDTKERIWYPIIKGNVGDSFSIRENELNRGY